MANTNNMWRYPTRLDPEMAPYQETFKKNEASPAKEGAKLEAAAEAAE